MNALSKINRINASIIEAKRFVYVAYAWRDRLKCDNANLSGSKEGAACKRASMDLTRCLAELRKS